jgi:hypothetical protein
VGSKWITLAFVSSLGLLASVCPSNTGSVLGADDEPAASEPSNSDERPRAVELLRQATIELEANRFEAARSLARQAAKLNAHFSLFDTRPEHVLAEIDRRESSGVRSEPVIVQVGASAEAFGPSSDQSKGGRTGPIAQASLEQSAGASPAASPPTPEQTKARAIAILDRGLQALDEKRLDDAERCARAAQALHAAWNKLEYKPENLITEVGIARASIRLAAGEAQAGSQSISQSSASPTSTGASAQPQPSAILRSELFRDPAPVPAAPTPAKPRPQAAPATAPVPIPAPTAAAHSRPAQSTATAQGANSSRERAERLLQEALTDLREGRDDVARSRIEGALGVIHPSAARPLPLLFPGSNPPIASLQPHASLPDSAMPRAGLPSYAVDRTADERDLALKPMHDPFLGDAPMSTQTSTAGEKTLREGSPRVVSVNPNYQLDRPLPVITDDVVRPDATWSKSTNATPAVIQKQAATETPTQSAGVRWPEGESATSTSQKAAAPGSQIELPSTAAVVPPVQSEAKSSAASTAPSGAPYSPPTTDPWAPGSAEEQRPGYFHRIWSALIGN